ncbi:phytanoyl-CoA dioxygenase family protein [Rubinisphaera brasiliensis]|uniref:Phytanoyl-CoA dioxygenase n=1 Tax=Rubinisphaera brasiliensis (strain ATCC 49424 / DSM 5305 / JCM 21570 / IAM 15109 / NBRC 103401 / IFAM 1448) TaxID=756272 RepID=F0SR43_RUBBR|nr:phytanoyl-CoA dioxygenase family protein [Rubinisphaera brasiliensis]ADY61290.1 Phytanoyl-CoA dioxygenase [Rubinisphaera brasiliensis DSM 5305]
MMHHHENIVRDGYTVVDDVFDADTMLAWRDTLRHLQRSQSRSVYSTVHWYRNILELCPTATWAAITKPVLLMLLDSLMGPFVQLDGVSLVAFDPLPEIDRPVRGWHRDRWAEFPQGRYTRPRAVHVLCYLQDITDTSGPLRVIPGSHVRPVAIEQPDERASHSDEVLLFPKRGQAVVLHNQLLHSGSLHSRGGQREFCSICFNHCWMKQPDDFSGPNCRRLRMEARGYGDRGLLRLLGVDEDFGAGLNRSNCGFLRPDTVYWDEWQQEDRLAAIGTLG